MLQSFSIMSSGKIKFLSIFNIQFEPRFMVYRLKFENIFIFSHIHLNYHFGSNERFDIRWKIILSFRIKWKYYNFIMRFSVNFIFSLSQTFSPVPPIFRLAPNTHITSVTQQYARERRNINKIYYLTLICFHVYTIISE